MKFQGLSSSLGFGIVLVCTVESVYLDDRGSLSVSFLSFFFFSLPPFSLFPSNSQVPRLRCCAVLCCAVPWPLSHSGMNLEGLSCARFPAEGRGCVKAPASRQGKEAICSDKTTADLRIVTKQTAWMQVGTCQSPHTPASGRDSKGTELTAKKRKERRRRRRRRRKRRRKRNATVSPSLYMGTD